jgi:uncharacterized protein (UPF0262 family)
VAHPSGSPGTSAQQGDEVKRQVQLSFIQKRLIFEASNFHAASQEELACWSGVSLSTIKRVVSKWRIMCEQVPVDAAGVIR